MTTVLIPLPVAIPLVVAAFLALTGKPLPRWVVDLISIATALASLGMTAFILRSAWIVPQVYWFGNWWPRSGGVALGIDFYIDVIGAALALLVALLTCAALIFSWEIFEETENHFQPLMLIFMAAMCGFCYAADLFNIFVFFELMSVSAFALCGLKTLEPAPLQGAYNFAVLNTIGAFMIVIGIGLLYARTGALNFAQVGRSLGNHADALLVLAFLVIAVGYLIKAAVAPFHFWLADAHAVAPSPVCVLFSGIMVELGIYAVARIYWTVFAGSFASHIESLRAIFLTLGVVTIVVGSLMCYAEHHLKRLLAFSTIAHSGIMLLGIGLISPHAIGGFIVYLLAHGVIKGGLFLCAGIVLHRLRKIGEDHLHGRGRGMWFTAGLFLAGAWGLAGAPPFGTLLGESMISHSAERFQQSWLAYAIIFAEILTSAAVLRFAFRVFWGWGDVAPIDEASQIEEKPETEAQQERTPLVMAVPATLLIVLGIAITFVPHLQSIAQASGNLFANQSEYTQIVLDNVHAARAITPTTEELASSIVRGCVALALACLLAFASLFYRKLGKMLHFAHALETGNSHLRKVHSGHPGDYAAWLSFGAAVFGIALLWAIY